MDDMLKNQSENINENEWTFLLLMMLMEDIKQRNSQWKSFENELIYNNRFSVKHPVIDEIHECQESATKIIKEGTILYRARVFDKSNFDKLVKYCNIVHHFNFSFIYVNIYIFPLRWIIY